MCESSNWEVNHISDWEDVPRVREKAGPEMFEEYDAI